MVETTETFVNNFVTPKKCEVSGKTTVGGKSCGCCVEAENRTKLVHAAIKDIKMTYKVGKESTCCSQSAGALAKKSGEQIKYVINKEETCCSHTARLNLARAKYAAAVEALVAADQAAAKKAETQTKAAGG